MSGPAEPDASASGAYRSYKLESGTFRDRHFLDGVVLVDEERKLLELRQFGGKKRKEETVVARFRVEPHAEVTASGPVLKVSELSLTLESAEAAGAIADVLRRPAVVRDETKLLSQAEGTIKASLEAREEALTFLSQMKLDPRATLIGAESMWAAGDSRAPFDAVYSGYSAKVADAVETTKSFLAGAQATLGPRIVERLFALAYTIGAVQDRLFQGDTEFAEELAALQELGIAATAAELKMDKPSERLVQRAHASLESLGSGPAPASEPLS